MKLIELIDTHLKETLQSPLPFTQESPTRYVIPLSDNEKIIVGIDQRTLQRYECASIIFRNPNAKPGHETALTGYFNGPGAIRILSTIIAILEPINFDLLILLPDDIDVEVEKTKTRLYKIVMSRLQRAGGICGHEELNFPEFIKPVLVALRGDGCDLEQIERLVKRYGIEKFAQVRAT